jgi:26S proteasome regulatory subunit N3
MRSTLMAAHCTAGLRHDAVGQETLLNLLLRNYLAYNLYDQVRKQGRQAAAAAAFASCSPAGIPASVWCHSVAAALTQQRARCCVDAAQRCMRQSWLSYCQLAHCV